MAVEHFIRRMRKLAELTVAETRFLEELVKEPSSFDPGQDIVGKGQKTRYLHVFLEGWACRYVDMADGERQILACLLPGDISNRYLGPAGRFNYSVAALSHCRVAAVPAGSLAGIGAAQPNIARALWLSSLMEEAIAREWMISLGRRAALQSISHLLCEFRFRLSAVGLTVANGFEFPVTQREIADMVGMSVVHVNRILGEIRSQGLIEFGSGWMTILNLSGLMEACDFDAGYLDYESAETK